MGILRAFGAARIIDCFDRIAVSGACSLPERTELAASCCGKPAVLGGFHNSVLGAGEEERDGARTATSRGGDNERE